MADYSDARHGRSEYGEGIGTNENRAITIKPPQTIGGQLTFMLETLQTQDELLKVIEERLSPILARDMTEETEGYSEADDVSIQSDIAETLESYARRAVRHNRRLQRILDRVNI